MVFCWMELDFMSLEGNAMSSSDCWGIYAFAMALENLFINVQGCVPVFLED